MGGPYRPRLNLFLGSDKMITQEELDVLINEMLEEAAAI